MDPFARERRRMVERQLVRRGIRDPAVLRAMSEVPRHWFVPPPQRAASYEDRAIGIECGQTISQPYMVAVMTELLKPDQDDVVLEIGTGSGYQAAVLAEIVKKVYTIEIVKPLGERAAAVLKKLGYDNVEVKVGDGYLGWPEHAPFDGIIVTAAPDHVPEPLKQQLKVGGRLVIPVGPQSRYQELTVLTKRPDGSLEETRVMPVQFVPLTGEHVEKDS